MEEADEAATGIAAAVEEPPPPEPRLQYIHTVEEHAAALEAHAGCLVIAFFGEATTDPVERARGFLNDCAADPAMAHLTFAIVDVDDDRLFAQQRIATLPAFQVMWLGEMVAQFWGSDELKLLSELSRVQAAIHPRSGTELIR